MEIKVYNLAGEVVAAEEIDVEAMGPVNESVLYYAVNACRANRRQGTASTKTRGEVSGGGRKPWRQKGTGRARVGSNRSPLWRGGGVIFGPKPRRYRVALPVKVRRSALREALKSKVSGGRMLLLRDCLIEKPKTKLVGDFMKKAAIDGRVTFFLSAGSENMRLSGRNIPGIVFADPGAPDLAGILKSDYLVVGMECWPDIAGRLSPAAAPDRPAGN